MPRRGPNLGEAVNGRCNTRCPAPKCLERDEGDTLEAGWDCDGIESAEKELDRAYGAKQVESIRETAPLEIGAKRSLVRP